MARSRSNLESATNSRVSALADMAATKAQQVANAARDEADHIRAMGNKAVASVEDWSSRAGDTARRGIDWARESADDVRYGALRAVDRSADFVRHQPLRSVVVAVVAGAAIMALIHALQRRDD